MITGGTGYVGTRFVEFVRQRGHRVTLLCRQPGTFPGGPAIRCFEWSLGAPPPAAAFLSDLPFGAVDTMLHLAHQWQSDKPESDDENVQGSAALFSAAREHEVGRIVYCSSVSARKDAPNRYGRVKWAVETLLSGKNETAARVGLVYGGPAVGQWGTLGAMVRATPVLPIPFPGTLVQPIHLDEVCAGLLSLAERPSLGKRTHGLATAEPIAFGRFLQQVARIVFGRSIIIVPIPVWLGLAIAEATRLVPFLPTVDRERVLGLAGVPTIDTATDLAAMGLSPRSLADGLAGEAAMAARLNTKR